MKNFLLLLVIAITFSGCSSSKYGCPATNSSGPKFKATKFKWE